MSMFALQDELYLFQLVVSSQEVPRIPPLEAPVITAWAFVTGVIPSGNVSKEWSVPSVVIR